MKLLIDTCVLFPTVMRHALLGACKIQGWTPLWSERILEEWAHSARKLGPEGEIQARGEIALLKADWPNAIVSWPAEMERQVWLPDENDRHVLAAAIAGSADMIVTLNARDFPRGYLREEGLDRIDPDALLMQTFLDHPEPTAQLAEDILQVANTFQGGSGQNVPCSKRRVCHDLPRRSRIRGFCGRRNHREIQPCLRCLHPRVPLRFPHLGQRYRPKRGLLPWCHQECCPCW